MVDFEGDGTPATSGDDSVLTLPSATSMASSSADDSKQSVNKETPVASTFPNADFRRSPATEETSALSPTDDTKPESEELPTEKPSPTMEDSKPIATNTKVALPADDDVQTKSTAPSSGNLDTIREADDEASRTILDGSTKKGVKFNLEMEVREGRRGMDISDEGASDLWYTKDDFALVRQEVMATVEAMRMMGTIGKLKVKFKWLGVEHCTRGIEHFRCVEDLEQKYTHTESVRKAVLKEQTRQRLLGIYNDKKLALASSSRSEWAVASAQKLAMLDTSRVRRRASLQHVSTRKRTSSIDKHCILSSLTLPRPVVDDTQEKFNSSFGGEEMTSLNDSFTGVENRMNHDVPRRRSLNLSDQTDHSAIAAPVALEAPSASKLKEEDPLHLSVGSESGFADSFANEGFVITQKRMYNDETQKIHVSPDSGGTSTLVQPFHERNQDSSVVDAPKESATPLRRRAERRRSWTGNTALPKDGDSQQPTSQSSATAPKVDRRKLLSRAKSLNAIQSTPRNRDRALAEVFNRERIITEDFESNCRNVLSSSNPSHRGKKNSLFACAPNSEKSSPIKDMSSLPSSSPSPQSQPSGRPTIASSPKPGLITPSKPTRAQSPKRDLASSPKPALVTSSPKRWTSTESERVDNSGKEKGPMSRLGLLMRHSSWVVEGTRGKGKSNTQQEGWSWQNHSPDKGDGAAKGAQAQRRRVERRRSWVEGGFPDNSGTGNNECEPEPLRVDLNKVMNHFFSSKE